MRVTTWNVNGLATRLARVLRWLERSGSELLCLQEIKMEASRFPYEAFAALGYRALVAGQKGYNGVAILARASWPEPSDVQIGIPGFADPAQRALAASFGPLRVVNLYVVNGQAVGSAAYAHKLAWLEACTRWLERECAQHGPLLVMGDFNIAPTDEDVHDPAAWAGQVLCSEQERAYFRRWLALGLVDTFRLFADPPVRYSWWDYRRLAFPKNHGLRIDHILASPELAERCIAVTIDRNERKGSAEDKPSDHAPVTAVFSS
ncbi:MAG: exodeoxyribonuclease III [Casimicrobiaceae bacterium]|nr:exodeoxyribonuclease III [Casimicrobiaceae bacterium]MCX8097474.1 exodeoxyribonuclease III [Casimicrobiaceae bacterium]MDW8311192.1 exodeoxyribonuclease III [Burkholderiales bacterium]